MRRDGSSPARMPSGSHRRGVRACPLVHPIGVASLPSRRRATYPEHAVGVARGKGVKVLRGSRAAPGFRIACSRINVGRIAGLLAIIVNQFA